jgi:protein O-GlcNAc transferase
MLLKWILPVVCVVVALGCESNKKTLTQKEGATQQWSRARASVMFGLAKDQYSTGNFDASRKTVDEAKRLDPDNGPLRVLSAKLAIESGELDLANRELEKARAINPKDAEADYLSGVVYQRWQKPDIAYNYYSSASDKEPGELAYVLARSEMLVTLDRREEALHLLQEKVVYFENSGVIRDGVGQLLMQSQRYGEAADILRQASILATDDLTIQEHLGLALFLAGRYAEAIEPLNRAVKSEQGAKRADLLLALGRSQLETGRIREARQSLETAAQLDASNYAVWLSLGRAAMQLGDFKRAELSLRRAQSTDPTNSEARLMMGYLRLKEGKITDALASFQRASALDGGDTVSLCMVGYALQQLGRQEQAAQYYTKALKIKPGDEMARKLLASVDLKE